VNEDKTQIMTK